MSQVSVPQNVRVSAERSIRHARRVIQAAESEKPSDTVGKSESYLLSLEHNAQILRREVVRAMRYQQLELLWATGGTLRPSSRTLRGTKAGLASFVNRVCYAATRELGCFAFPLLPYNTKRDSSDTRPFWDTDGLSISRSADGEWIVQSSRSVASSEVTTEVEDGVGAEYEDFEGQEPMEECLEEKSEHNNKEKVQYSYPKDNDLMDE